MKNENLSNSPAAEGIYLKWEYIQNFIFAISLVGFPHSKTDWYNLWVTEHFYIIGLKISHKSLFKIKNKNIQLILILTYTSFESKFYPD